MSVPPPALGAAYGFGEMEPLRTLLTAAGFRDIHIHIVVLTMRHPTPAEFIAGQLAATPLAGAVARSMPLHRWPYATTSWRPSARIRTMRARGTD